MQRFRDTLTLFQQYGNQYGFDTLLLLAQGYQESRLDQSRRSPVGALGLVQLMPKTGNSLGVGDIHYAAPNVHAGAKYMAELMDEYFKGIPFDEQNRTLFAFAAYNAGPGKVQSLRREAEAQHLDPNVWFDNVERVAAARVGQEPVRYVRNIYKYYVAYTLIQQAEEAKKAALAATKTSPTPITPAASAPAKPPLMAPDVPTPLPRAGAIELSERASPMAWCIMASRPALRSLIIPAGTAEILEASIVA
jgi:membrane-bound lytic murein transglycosylase MltF